MIFRLEELKMRKCKMRICQFGIIVLVILILFAGTIIYLDPFFHYHKPLEGYFYARPETIERYQNDGIVRNFDYDAVITGISVSAGFSTSEFDALFDVNSVKIIYSGGTYKEIGEGIRRALHSNPNTKIVINNLFIEKIYQEKDHRRSDLTDFPTYLYNDNPFDDIRYFFNKDVFFTYCYSMLKGRVEGTESGVQSVDTTGYILHPDTEIRYSNPEVVYGERKPINCDVPQEEISESEKKNAIENVTQNIVESAKEHPNTRFIYFVPPCSILYYRDLYESGELLKILEAEQIAINLMLEQENIEVYTYSYRHDIIEDLRNYVDSVHYGSWINSFVLDSIAKGEGRLTKENVSEYLENEKKYYLNYNY